MFEFILGGALEDNAASGDNAFVAVSANTETQMMIQRWGVIVAIDLLIISITIFVH